MPGTNAGTGQPITLKCSQCRKTRWRRSDLEATGRTKPVPRKRWGSQIGVRQTNRLIEYRCLTCSHVGWSQHVDGERLLRRVK